MAKVCNPHKQNHVFHHFDLAPFFLSITYTDISAAFLPIFHFSWPRHGNSNRCNGFWVIFWSRNHEKALLGGHVVF